VISAFWKACFSRLRSNNYRLLRHLTDGYFGVVAASKTVYI
jgi:hypothetical protein